MNTLTKIKHTTQKGFTFVELLIIMIVVAILSGIGIQFVLSTQEDKAKLTNAKSFLAKDMPTAIYSCILRRDDITTCVSTALIVENIDAQTEWGDAWNASGTVNAGTESLLLCYSLASAGATRADEIGESLTIYLTTQTSWGANSSTYSYFSGAGTTGSVFAGCNGTDDQFAIQYVTRN